MKSQMYVLPVQCRACGSTFDLWHDLLEQGERGVEEMSARGLGEKEHLCWRCRQAEKDVRMESPVEVEEGEFELDWR